MKPKGWKILRWSRAAIGTALVLLAAMPLWFPWALGPAAKRVGLHYHRYLRHGYSHFTLESVSFTNAGARFTAERVQLVPPTVWAWHLFRSARLTYVSATNWNLTLAPAEKHSAPAITSTHSNAQRMAALLAKIGRWIPNALLINGSVQFKEQSFKIHRFAWNGGKWNAVIQPQANPAPINLEGEFAQLQPWCLKAAYPHLDLKGNFRADLSGSNLLVRGAITFQTNQLDVTADFGRSAQLPGRAVVQCRSFTLPGRTLKLDAYGAVTGSASFLWSDGRFVSELDAHAAPPAASQLPPLDVALQARGTLAQAELKQLKIALPGFQAELSTNVVIPLTTGAPPAVLNLTGNLGQQPWIPVEGFIAGKVLLTAGANIIPRAAFNLAATNVAASKIRSRSVILQANFSWPFFEVTQSRAEIDASGVLEISGTLDLARKEIHRGRLDFSGQPAAGLPSKYKIEALACSARFDGAINDLRHNETIQARGFHYPQIKTLDAEITTRGHGRTVEGQVMLRAGNSVMRLTGGGEFKNRTNNFSIKELSLASGAQELLRLQAPVSVGFVAGSTTSNRWQLNLPQTTFRGASREVALRGVIRWPSEGILAGQIHGIALRDFEDLITAQWNPIQVEDLAFETQWRNGPAKVNASVTASYTANPGFTAEAQIDADLDGVLISNLTVRIRSAPVVLARGFLPLTINPGNATRIIAWKPSARLDLKAKMEPDPEFWRRIFELTGVEVVHPDLNIDLSGSWNSPTGRVHATVSKARLTRIKPALPPIEEFQLDAQFDAQTLRVDQFRFLVEKQPVLVSAELPLDASFYDSLSRRRLPDWQRGRARLRIQRAPIAAFMRYMPRILTPIGVLDVDVAVNGPQTLNGEILIEGATTYPLGDFGAVRDITNRVVFRGQRAILNSVATIGGEPLHASGTVDLKGMRWLQGEMPPFQIKLTGQKVPLARQPEVIVRSDFDLGIVHTNSNQPLISGTVRLRDSFYTSDLDSLIPGRLAQASHRPPYFSVEVKPIAEWRLDCLVTGDEFLKLRAPFFQGTVSANFKLGGTLQEPFASGEATVPKGRVEFPFGTLEVKQGIVSLTAGNPFQPDLYVTARARRFGYDITMEVTGPAGKPVIQFSSVPSLTSEQILLLLTAGEIPRDQISLTPQQKAQRFAVFLAQRLLAKLGFGGGSERLIIRSAEDVSDTGHQTYDVEYKLDKNWSIVGQYDRFNAFNLSLKRRIYSR